MTALSEIFSPGVPLSAGIRVGDLIHGSRISGEDAGGALPEALEDQLQNAFANMQSALENAGSSLDAIAQVSVFFENGKEGMPLLNAIWVDRFPDAHNRPTYKFITAPLFGGRKVQLEFFAVADQPRQVIQLPVVAHTNPIPMGVRMGDYLFTSRVLPFDPESGEPGADTATQTDFVFANIAATLELGGMSWADVKQGRLFLSDMADLKGLEARWAAEFSGKAAPLHPLPYAVAPTLLVMLEIIAAKI
ncbi:MAG: hypothetical protein HQ503_09270 [Rhodospirillales bacterium]|nr:hypothetical protein [Rhodospirillales bacterium]